ncbi:MAG: GntR family transcriptional regulator [Planctomycetaceae bacterium]
MTARSQQRRHAAQRGRRRQAIVEAILTSVFRGELRPGQHLVTEQLAVQFGVSHTPIREALAALAGMGAIELLPNRGAKVRQVGPRDVAEITHVRRVLEFAATRSACGRIDLAALDELRTQLEKLTTASTSNAARFIRRARELDSKLHDLIWQSCGNSFLGQELERLKTLFRVFRDVSWERAHARNDPRRLRDEAHEHLAIVDALRMGDTTAASAAMSRHIRAGTRYWSRAVQRPKIDSPAAGGPVLDALMPAT